MINFSRCWYFVVLALVTGGGTCETVSRSGATQATAPVREPASFWAAIANDSDYSVECRRTCIFELFRRHIRAGMTLGEVADRLNKPNWLRDEWTFDKSTGSGYMPVKFALGDTVFAIGVLPPSGERNWSYVCMRVSGRLSAEELGRALRGEAVTDQVRAAKLNEIGFAEY